MGRKTFKERYPCTCIKCGKEFDVAPSWTMTEFGMNSGSGTCTGCKTYLKLTIHPDLFGETMKSEIFDEWLESQGIKKRVRGEK
jgi:NAD-dependent SIR2 family protein deacetylase